MKKKFSVEQVEAGVPIAELIPKFGLASRHFITGSQSTLV